MRYWTLILLSFVILTGCASNGTNGNTTDQPPSAETLYQRAQTALEKGRHVQAAQLFDDVEREYPYSELATKAQLLSGYAYYEAMRYDDAVLALQRFIDLHPGNDQVDYAYYLRAISFYEQISDVQRDQSMTERAQRALQNVINRFPDTDYARDAQLKLDLTRDHLAGKEMEIGRYYQNLGQWQSAINRFQTVIQQYDTTTHTPEALHRLTESYLALGLTDQARRTAAVLGHNYPQSDWYSKSYALFKGGYTGQMPQPDDESTIRRLINTVF